MARQLICGFEIADTDSSAYSCGGTFSIQNTIARASGYALQINPTTSALGWMLMHAQLGNAWFTARNFDIATAFFRFYFYIVTKPTVGYEQIANMKKTMQVFALGINNLGQIVVEDSSGNLVAQGTKILQAGQWYRIEGRYRSGTPSVLDVFVDGASEVSATCKSTSALFGQLYLGKLLNRNSNSIEVYYDDCVIDDSDFCGAGNVERAIVGGNGTLTQWNAGTNLSDYLEIDEYTPDGDTTYIKCPNTVNSRSVFPLQAISNTKPIKGITIWAKARSDASSSFPMPIIKSGGTVFTDTGLDNVNTTYRWFTRCRAIDPFDNLGWTRQKLNSLEIGVEVLTAIATRATVVTMEIDYAEKKGSLALSGVG